MHLDNWLFVLFAAIALLFRWLAGQAAKANKDGNENERRSTSASPPDSPPLRPTRADSQEEQIRKFLEALGRPPTSSPPTVVRPRSDIPPRPVAPITPPREMVATPSRKRTAPPPLPQVQVRDETPNRPEKVVVSPPATPVPSAVPANLPALEIVRPQDTIDVVALLNSRSGPRDAIVLREIFGPPRSLQDVDLIGIA